MILSGLICGALLGFVMQRGRFCLTGGFLRTCTLKCGYWQCHTSFLGESVTTKRKKSIDLAVQSGAANEVVSRYGSASKEHLVSYSGVDSQYINGIKIWNK